MIKRAFPLFVLCLFAGLPLAFGSPSIHSLTLIYSNNLYGSIESSG